MEILKPFHVDAFNSINGLGDANDAFLANNGPELVYSSILELFRDHSVLNTFAVCLVHRHFDLGQGEILVDTNGTATSWNVEGAALSGGQSGASTCYSKYGGHILPMSWKFDSTGHLIPYEFFFVPNANLQHENAFGGMSIDVFFAKHSTFTTQFRDILDAHGLLGVLGLRLLRDSDPAHGTIEFTESQCNITIPAAPDFMANMRDASDNYIAATWAFKNENADGAFPGKTVGFCVSACFNPMTGQIHVKAHVRHYSFTSFP